MENRKSNELRDEGKKFSAEMKRCSNKKQAEKSTLLDGWMDAGWKSRFKDCLEQLKTEKQVQD